MVSKAGILAQPFYLILVPLFPAVQLYSNNSLRLTLPHFLATAIALVAGFMLVRYCVNKCLGSRQRNDLVLSLAAIAACYGIFLGALYQYIGLFVAVSAFVIRYEKPRKTLALWLNIMLILMMIKPLLKIIEPQQWLLRGDVQQQIHDAYRELPNAVQIDAKSGRDFYYIILDRYARADQLAAVYGFDNTPFLTALKERGFQVSHRSFSNYQRTAHSIASSLNLDYLNKLDAVPADSSRDWVPLYGLLRDSRLVKFMKAAGFEFHSYGSWWEPTRKNPLADETNSYRAWPEMLRVLFEYSLFGKAANFFGVQTLQSLWLQCHRPGHKFSHMAANSGIGGRKFVFAHFLVPHPPFVLTESGACMSVSQARSRSRVENYIGQVKYTNREVLNLIDHLQAAKGPKPVIVLQADEGPWPEKYAGDELRYLGRDITSVNWLKVTPAELREKMGILNAQYLPGIEQPDIADETTPVNTFRRVLRHYFDLPLADLPDRNYVFESGQRLYHFHDVTDKLKNLP